MAGPERNGTDWMSAAAHTYFLQAAVWYKCRVEATRPFKIDIRKDYLLLDGCSRNGRDESIIYKCVVYNKY